MQASPARICTGPRANNPADLKARIPQLDAVRGLAILAVIFHNQSGKYPSLHLSRVFANGWMGVDLFFVLSGFLITGILLDTKGSKGSLKSFYIRRGLRTWPLYFAVILFMFVAVPWLRPAQGHLVFERSSPWWSFTLFVQNFLVPNLTGAAGALAVTWSLAVEEQFYLVWPWVVRHCSAVQLRWIAVSVICLSPLLRAFLLGRGVNLYTNTFCRLDGLMAGALLALLTRSSGFVPSKYITLAGITFITTATMAFVLEAMHLRWVVYSMSALASLSLVYLALYSKAAWIQRPMTNRFLVYTGTISYGLYLLHKIPFDIGEALHLDRKPFLAAPLLLLASFGIAALSWNLLEKPFLSLKKHFEPKPTPARLEAGETAERCFGS